MASLAINIPRDHKASSMIDSQLHKCVRLDDIDDFISRVQTHSAEELVTPCGNTLLHVAVSYESARIIAYLAEEFPSLITTQNNQQDTVLHLAARRGTYSDAIKTLAQSNPRVARMTNEKGNTPLHDSVIKGNRELATFLVSEDPEVAYHNNMNGRSPLYLAVENGNKNGILDDLLNSGASIPIRYVTSSCCHALPKGKSPVHAAIERRDKDILEKIERAKPELLRLTDEELGNSLHYASSKGFLKGVQFLLQKFHDGAYETNLEGNYPIHLACNVDVVKEYLDRFPYPEEFLNKKGQNILHVAAKYGNWSVISYILKQDPKLVEPLLNATDKDGNTPLHLAACYGQHMASFLLLLDNRVDRFIVNNKNSTPYDLAAEISRRANEQYEITAGERKQNDSKNNTPADEIKGNKADSEKIAVDYFGAVMTLAILYFHACPKKSLFERFQRPMPIRGQEVKSLIGNLLVAAVLVAGVTFAGAIQLPQFRDNNNPGDIHHELNSTSRISSIENLMDEYVSFDMGALSTSLVAALILLFATFNYPEFQIAAVVLSTSLVYWAIVMMFWALSSSLEYGGIFVSGTITVMSWMLPLGYWLLISPCFDPHPASQIFLQKLLHCFYYIYFLQSIFIMSWLAHKLNDLQRKLSRH